MPTSRPLAILVLLVPLAFVSASCREVSCPEGQRAEGDRCVATTPQPETERDAATVDPCSACAGATPFCDASTGACFACRTDGDCPTRAAPVCDEATRACARCSTNDDCDRFDEVCDAESGRCVECTAETEEQVCRGFSCHPAHSRCTMNLLGQTGRCSPCEADSECIAGSRCVDFQRHGDAPVERVCLPVPSNGACADSPRSFLSPYGYPTTVTAASGGTLQVCTPPSTCGATLAYLQRRSCTIASDCSAVPFAAGCLSSEHRCSMWCKPPAGDTSEATFCSSGDVCTNILCQTAPP